MNGHDEVFEDVDVVGLSIVENEDGNINYRAEVKSSCIIDGKSIEALDYVDIPIS